jgi:hypothetical protein
MSNQILSAYTEFAIRNINEGREEVAAARAGSRGNAPIFGGGGFLMAIAQALGEMMDRMADNLLEFSKTLGDSPTAEQTTELTAKSQMFSLFMNNASTVIKTLGEANAAMARKQ